MQGLTHHRRPLFRINPTAATRARCIFLDAGKAAFRITLPPPTRFLTGDTHRLANLLILQAVGRMQYDRGTLGQAYGNPTARPESFEPASFCFIQCNGNGFSHAPIYTERQHTLHVF